MEEKLQKPRLLSEGHRSDPLNDSATQGLFPGAEGSSVKVDLKHYDARRPCRYQMDPNHL